MARDPLRVVEDYLKSSDPRVRSNAVRALSVVESLSSERLVRMALSDPDPEVKNAAEATLQKRRGSVDRNADAAVWHDLLRDSGLRQSTYALMGRLSAAGAAVTVPALPYTHRLRLAYDLRRSVRPQHRGVRYYLFRLLLPPAAGAAMASVLVSLLLDGFALSIPHASKDPDVLQTLFVSSVFWVGFTLLTAWRTVAIGHYVDRPAGILVEVLVAGVLAALPIIVVAVLIWLFNPAEFDAGLWLLLGVTFGLAAATRSGVLLANGVALRGGALVAARLFLGTAAGLLVWTILCAISAELRSLWLILSPYPAALAFAFAFTDMRGPQLNRPRISPLARTAATAIIVPIGAAIFALLWPVGEPPTTLEMNLAEVKASRKEQVTKLPYKLVLRSDRPQRLLVKLTIQPPNKAAMKSYRYAFCGPPADPRPKAEGIRPAPQRRGVEKAPASGRCSQIRNKEKIGGSGVGSLNNQYDLGIGEYELLLFQHPALFGAKIDVAGEEDDVLNLVRTKMTRMLWPEQRNAEDRIELFLEREPREDQGETPAARRSAPNGSQVGRLSFAGRDARNSPRGRDDVSV